MTDAERNALIQAQKDYAAAVQAPLFMPGNGRCWHCGCDLVQALGDRLRTELFTGCPKCLRSYCD